MKQDLKSFEPERILVIQLRQMGDVLLTTPALRALRRRYPGAFISYLVEPVPGEVLRGNPCLNEIINRPTDGSWLEPFQTISRVRQGRFDLVIDYLANPRTSLITMLSGARVSISYAHRRRNFAYTHPTMPEGVFSANHKLSLLRVLGCETGCLDLEMEVPAAAEASVRDFLAREGIDESRPVVCLYPFHKRPVREWMPEYFADLADRIKREWKAAVIVLWGPGRDRDAERFIDTAGEKHHLAPPMDIYELAAFCKRADIFVGNDGGPRHIAASQKTPTFIVVGPSTDSWTPPSDINATVSNDVECRPCDLPYCPEKHHACLRELKPDSVFERLKQFKNLLEKRD